MAYREKSKYYRDYIFLQKRAFSLKLIVLFSSLSRMPHPKKSAFTLVELIVVIAVLAVLASIAFSTVANVSSSA